jgi:5-formyltetrahydrofolate cyclo-ligase
MEARAITGFDDLAPGAYGIPEPVEHTELVPADRIDLIILPCMACDKSCRRIGHGAGYYDKYLQHVRKDCRTVAMCYSALLADELPVEEHDMPVDAVVTEDAVYRWRREDREDRRNNQSFLSKIRRFLLGLTGRADRR